MVHLWLGYRSLGRSARWGSRGAFKPLSARAPSSVACANSESSNVPIEVAGAKVLSLLRRTTGWDEGIGSEAENDLGPFCITSIQSTIRCGELVNMPL